MPAVNPCGARPADWDAVIAAERVGGARNLARLCNPAVSRQAVEKWIRAAVIPPRRVPEVSKLSGVPKGLLNPLFK